MNVLHGRLLSWWVTYLLLYLLIYYAFCKINYLDVLYTYCYSFKHTCVKLHFCILKCETQKNFTF